MNGTVKMLVVICVTLAVLWLLSSCAADPCAANGGRQITYYDQPNCFWPAP